MIDVAMLPSEVLHERLSGAQVVVLDVLRATTTAVTALANGAHEVRLFGDVDSAREAREQEKGRVVLGGERHCVRIAGFDAGNSPGEYGEDVVGGATVLLTTTNGTRAAAAVSAASELYLGAIVNATATARVLAAGRARLDTILVCAGTDGGRALEDVIGAGAILAALLRDAGARAGEVGAGFTDSAWIAHEVFVGAAGDLAGALRRGRGGAQLMKAGFGGDIELCARLDARPIAVRVLREPLRAVLVEA